MRRAVAFALCVILASSSLLAGCGPVSSALKPRPKAPFTTDYELAEGNVDFFLANDTVETAMTGGPFYAGARALPSQNAKAFEEARAAKVESIKTEAEALVKAADAAKPAMAALRSEYIAYLDKVYKEEKGLADIAEGTMKKVGLRGAQEVLAEQQYLAMTEQETTQTYVAAARDYVAVTKAVELGGLYLTDANEIAGFAAIMLDGLADSKSPKVQAANKAFDAKMETVLGAALEALEPVAAHSANIDAGLKQLASADYYFAREAQGWMRSKMAELGPKVEALKAREGMSAEEAGAIKAFYAAFEEWNEGLEGHLSSLNTSDLVAVSDPEPVLLFGEKVAYAAEGYEEGKDFGAANQVLAMSTEGSEPEEGYLSKGWSAVKSGFGKAKTVVGTGIDVIGLGVKNISTVGVGIYYGNSKQDIVDGIMSNTKDFTDNYNKGVSGSDTLQTAGGYLEGIETGAGDTAGGAAEWGVEKVLGKGKVSGAAGWAVNGLTKITVGMFTGLGKGIYKVADKRSSSADVATGIVEIALGAIGGSKVLLKGSQIPGLLAGGKEGIKAFGKTVSSLIAGAANKAEGKQISSAIAELLVKKGLTKAEALNLVSNSIKLEINSAMAQLIKNSRAAMLKKVRDLVSQGGTGFLTNFKDTAKSSLQDLLQKGFKRSFQGYLDAGTTVIGGNLTDYVDNLIAAGLTDGKLVEIINTALSIPPDPEQVSGTWTGVVVILKATFPETEQKSAEQEGCENAFDELKSKRNPATFKIQLSAGGGGTVALNAGALGSGSGSARYSDGAITMVVATQGTTFTMKGRIKFDRQAGGMTMSGSWTAPYKGTGITMSGTFSGKK